MLQIKNKYLLETDILFEHLIQQQKNLSVMEEFLLKGICFTTVINASELFMLVRNEIEYQRIKNLLSVVNVLGIHSRYSLIINEFNKAVKTTRDALICAAAKINKLTIVTFSEVKFKNSNINYLIP